MSIGFGLTVWLVMAEPTMVTAATAKDQYRIVWKELLVGPIMYVYIHCLIIT
jgi:hypothetical protein